MLPEDDRMIETCRI